MGNRGGSDRRSGALRLGAFIKRMVASPILGASAVRASSRSNPTRWARRAVPDPLARRAAHRLHAQSSRALAPRGPRAGRSGVLLAVAQKTWRYFDTFVGPSRPCAPARQRAGRARRADRTPDIADEHRDGDAGHAVCVRPALHRSRRHGRTPRGHTEHDRAPRAFRRAPAELVQHETLAPLEPKYRLDRRQRQSGRRVDYVPPPAMKH